MTTVVRNMSKKQAFQAVRDAWKASGFRFSSRVYSAVFARIMAEKALMTGIDADKATLAAQLAGAVDYSLRLDQFVEGLKLPAWLVSMPEFEGGRLPDYTWAEKMAERDGVEAVESAVWQVALEFFAQMSSEEDVRRPDWKLHRCEGYFAGKLLHPVNAVRSLVKYSHLTAHLRAPAVALDAPARGSRWTTDEDGDETWEEVIPSNSADLAAIADVSAEKAAYAKLAEEASGWGLDFLGVDEFGNVTVDWAHWEEFRRKKEVFSDVVRAAQSADGLAGLEDALKVLNLNAASMERTIEKIVENFRGKRARPGQEKNIGQGHEAEVAQLYQEELEAARRGEDLSVRGGTWLTAGQKTALTKVRNKALREKALKEKGLSK